MVDVNRRGVSLRSGDEADVLDLMLRHAADRPDALAMKDQRATYSYADLLARVKMAAASLASYGVEPGDRVALWLPNSTSLLITALGCLWLGAPFVPLSPNDPHARLGRAVADCDPAVIVGSDDGGEPPDPNAFGGRRVVDTRSLLENGNDPVPPQQRDPGRDAYLIYTSGTSGTPKGVRTPEAAFRAAITTAADLLELDATTRALCVSPFHFDGSYGTVFPTLVAGGALVIPPREQLLYVKPFYTALFEEGITHTGFTPSYLRLLLSWPTAASLSRTSLRTVGLGGEVCDAMDVANLWELHPTVRVFNRYGPTETTIQVTTYEVTQKDVESGIVPIGRPHPGVSFSLVAGDGTLILDPDEVGELYVGGNQLMKGYWGDNELTSQVLRDDVVPRTTVYRTGDLVYRDAEGRYVFVGRTDSVVKRNGVRVSLHEIARVLREVKGVSGAVCLPVDESGRLAIAAFVEAGPDITVAQLLQVMRHELPLEMVPDDVHLWSTFPVNSSGKVDRHCLVAEAGRVIWAEAAADSEP
jgi:D-alanine--poly(phosphoribitol) ligase subunit 1